MIKINEIENNYFFIWQTMFGLFQENKVVILDELALKFKLKTQVAIDRVQSLLEDGLLTGKFIKISCYDVINVIVIFALRCN